MIGHSWRDKLAWVGMTWEIVEKSMVLGRTYCKVRVSNNPGVSSFGDGSTFEEAIENAACGMNIDWLSVERRMTEADWAEIAHC